MNQQALQSLLKFLRDPIWQAVAVLVAVIAIFVTTTTSSPSNGELAIIHTHSIKFVDYLLPSSLIKLKLQKSSQGLDNTRIEYYSIINKGIKPILPADYTTPLTAESSSTKNKILLVDSCAQPTTISGEKAASSCTRDSFVPSLWKSDGTKWLSNPALLNPGDQFCVIVFIEPENQDSEPTNINAQWSGRIIGTKIRTYASLDEYSKSQEKRWGEYFSTEIKLVGYGAYWFALLQISIFYATLVLARQACWPVFRSRNRLGRAILVMLLSTSTAEILVDIFVNNIGDRLSPMVWPLLTAHAVLVLYLLIRSIKIRLGKTDGFGFK